jgi:phosphoenolpyruvate synthase/pyruvate phosphate dikinase
MGVAPVIDPEMSTELKELLAWADAIRTLKVRANTDTPEGARKARDLGAAGIGLCRTERMFNAVDRLPIVREMILAGTKEKRLTKNSTSWVMINQIWLVDTQELISLSSSKLVLTLKPYLIQYLKNFPSEHD